MIIFETDRLIIKSLEPANKKDFAELFTDPQVLNPIPQKAYTESQITERFNINLNLKIGALTNEKCACGIFQKGSPEMIGLCLFLINENDEQEIGYRFKVNHWGRGYGTETTKGMLNYYFKVLNVDKVTADVNIENVGSVKILNKFMKPVSEFYNERDNCTDRRYELKKQLATTLYKNNA